MLHADVRVGENAIIFGPAVLGCGVPRLGRCGRRSRSRGPGCTVPREHYCSESDVVWRPR